MSFTTYARILASLFLILPILGAVLALSNESTAPGDVVDSALGGFVLAIIATTLLFCMWPILSFVFYGRVL